MFGRRLAAAEMFLVHPVNALGSAKGLGLRLAGRWNHSETRKGIRNVQEVKTPYVVKIVSRD